MTNDNTKHTPGPWLIREGDQVITGGEPWHTHEWPSSPETLANARLIAAAPDLLAACQLALATDFDERFGDAEFRSNVRQRNPYGAERIALYEALAAAIAKATGDAS